jgi:cobyrinic acid a,c-diamide synthase
MRSYPRIVIAGLRGDAGKSFVSIGLIAALRHQGLRVAAFKKGPDYIDAAWLAAAAGTPTRNLDSFMMEEATIRWSLAAAQEHSDIGVVEGNRGLFDGAGASGKHSTAALAKTLDAPVILVVDTTKTSTTAAALVLGCVHMDPDLRIVGVVLNRVGTRRQERVIRAAIESTTGIPVLGALPRAEIQELPGRHLGLITTVEHCHPPESIDRIAGIIETHCDLSRIRDLAATASPLHCLPAGRPPAASDADGPRIGVLWDQAFSFYYPENIGRLRELGAQLIPISPLTDPTLPEIDLLYAGGGFPEVHAPALAANQAFRSQLANRIGEGLPVWAECGGLMYLARELTWNRKTFPMVGALPIAVQQEPRPQGHGYVAAVVDRSNPFFPVETPIRGHEFHYSRVTSATPTLTTMLALTRGTGLGRHRDGLLHGSVCACYTHFHALATPAWATELIRIANRGVM